MRTPTCGCGTPMLLVEIRDVYDGALFYGCSDCGETQRRFSCEESRLFALGEKYRAQWEAARGFTPTEAAPDGER